jgi:hypothetical protein
MNTELNRIVKIAIILLLTGVGLYISYTMYRIYTYTYSAHLTNDKEYLWVFKDSTFQNVDTNFVSHDIRETDILSTYIYNYQKEGECYIDIWEFKGLEDVVVEQIAIDTGINLSHVRFTEGETLNAHHSPESNVQYSPFFKHNMSISLDKYSRIDSSFSTPTYKGFYGVISMMTYNNEKGEPLVGIDYINGKKPNLVIVYKKAGSIYIIRVEPKDKLDPHIIDIFNLEPKEKLPEHNYYYP